MNCKNAQDAIQALHRMAKQANKLNEKKLEDAIEHLTDCDICRDWVNNTVCQFIKAQFSNGVLSEDVLIGHGMIHEIIGNPECISP